MVVKLFCDEEFSEHKHELNQFKEVFNIINEKYANSDEIIYILFNFSLANTQIDILILAKNGMAIIDLKAIKGKIIGDERGRWKAVNEDREEYLFPNLFSQLKRQKYGLIEKLNQIRINNFERIDENKFRLIECHGYFEKGSTFDIHQIGSEAHYWFGGIITADNLLEKIRLIDSHFMLLPKDMDAIVKGLHLKEYSFENIQMETESNELFEINYRKELSVFVQPQNWNEIKKKISISNILIIAGVPRVGKSTTILNLVNEMKNEGYKIIDEKDSLIKLFNSRDINDKERFSDFLKKKNVFILDDLFGTTEYEPNLGNIWVPFLLKILKSSRIESKFIIASREDILDEFLSSNKEMSYTGLEENFKDSIVKLNFSNYNYQTRKEIFEKNLEFIRMKDENKKSIIGQDNEKIINELILPGEIWTFLENAKDNDFLNDISIDVLIDQAKRQVHFLKEKIKSLNEHEKLFLYNIYINYKNFSAEEIEIIYSHCSSLDSSEHLFFDCINKFKDNIIKTKIEKEFLYTGKTINKIDFVHPVFIDSIEELLTKDVSESRLFGQIIFKIYDLLKLPIKGLDLYKQYLLKFNIFQKICSIGNENTKDLVFEILNSGSELYIDSKNLEYIDSAAGSYFCYNLFSTEYVKPTMATYGNEYFAAFLNNYNRFDDEVTRNYLSKYIQNNSDIRHIIAYVLAFDLESKLVKDVKFLLNEFVKFSKDFVIDTLITIFILRNHKEFDESEKKNLEYFSNFKEIQIPLLIPYSGEDDDILKSVLINLVSNSETKNLIEAIPHALLNYNHLPPQVKEKYEFVFKHKDKKIEDKLGIAFENWIFRFLNDLSKVSIDWSHLNKKVRDSFITWLKEGEYSGLLYGYSHNGYYIRNTHDRLLYKWIYYSGDQSKICFIDKTFIADENFNIYKKDFIPVESREGAITFKEHFTFREKFSPKVIEAIPSELNEAIHINIISLLKNLKTADYLFDWDDVPGEGSHKLVNLSEENNVEWVKKSQIEVTKEGIGRFFQKNDRSIFSINKDKNMAILKGTKEFDGETESYEIDWFKVKDENGKIRLYKKPLEKAEVMWVAFLLVDKEKPELEEAIIKAIEDDKTVLKAFFGDCEHFYEYPFKLSDFQDELIDNMMQFANEEIESTYDSFCDQRSLSDVNIEDYIGS